jgi:hypothetical protein
VSLPRLQALLREAQAALGKRNLGIEDYTFRIERYTEALPELRRDQERLDRECRRLRNEIALELERNPPPPPRARGRRR